MADDAATFGIVLPDEPEEEQEDVCEIWPENVETLNVFIVCGTQWRRSAMSGARIGLDYAGVAAAIDMMGIKRSPQLFADIQVMELAALEQLKLDRDGS